MSPTGTNLPTRNVRYMAAFGGDPDIELTAPEGRSDPKPTSTIKPLSGAEQFDEGGTKPTKGWIVVISLVPIDANVERRNGYR
jgi:hypothetical protein